MRWCCMECAISKPLMLSGRYFSKKELRQVQETVKMFPNLSRTELAFTICEHLSWVTPKGSDKVKIRPQRGRLWLNP